MILKPLQKIEVVESTKKWKPGSIGYFVCQSSVGNYNGWDILIVFTRFGKKGKRRIEPINTDIHMIGYDQLKKSDRNIMDIVKFAEGLEPRPHPSDVGKAKPRYTRSVGESVIAPIQMVHKDLLEIETWDFMAYVTALTLYINRISFDKDLYHVRIMPPLKMSEFVGAGSNLNKIRPHNVGYYIMRGLSMDAKKKTSVFEEIYLNFFDNMDNRQECLERLLLNLSACKEKDEMYKNDLKSRYRHVEQIFNNTLKHYRRSRKNLAHIKAEEGENAKNPYSRPYKSVNIGRITSNDVTHRSTTTKYIHVNPYTWSTNTDDAPEVAEEAPMVPLRSTRR